MVALEQEPKVVVCGVEDDLVVIHRLPDRFQVEVGEGIHEDGFARDGDLEQAQLLRVGMEGVRFGVECDPFGLPNACGEIPQLGGGADHGAGKMRKGDAEVKRNRGRISLGRISGPSFRGTRSARSQE